ncbi:MAG: hypothetical protein IKW96_09275 [Ruminococcus sp.]|uniref:hypothetical protein n=1 Tax=Ruminococcus sp. TaxID=41978 RepID=UPI0025CF7F80|nr:hypothetical protein [Ruminococcus sp.]MBR5683442.1 hypothetical protein [Ruminococcus sp.]
MKLLAKKKEIKMIQSYDFLIHAYRNEEFRQEINEHILMNEDSELTHYSALLKFDSANRIIREFPLEGAMFACKIIPMEISYDDFSALMNGDDTFPLLESACKFLE